MVDSGQATEALGGVFELVNGLLSIGSAPLIGLALKKLAGRNRSSMQALREAQELGSDAWGPDGSQCIIGPQAAIEELNVISLRMYRLPILSFSWMAGTKTEGATGQRDKVLSRFARCVLGISVAIVFAGIALIDCIVFKWDITALISTILLGACVVVLTWMSYRIIRCDVNPLATLLLGIVLLLIGGFALMSALLIKSFSSLDISFVIFTSLCLCAWWFWIHLSRCCAEIAVLNKFNGRSRLLGEDFDEARREYSNICNSLHLLPVLLVEPIIFFLL